VSKFDCSIGCSYGAEPYQCTLDPRLVLDRVPNIQAQNRLSLSCTEAALATTNNNNNTVKQECRAAYHLCVAERCHIRCCVNPHQSHSSSYCTYDCARTIVYTAGVSRACKHLPTALYIKCIPWSRCSLLDAFTLQ
jgi:hypothetical protein